MIKKIILFILVSCTLCVANRDTFFVTAKWIKAVEPYVTDGGDKYIISLNLFKSIGRKHYFFIEIPCYNQAFFCRRNYVFYKHHFLRISKSNISTSSWFPNYTAVLSDYINILKVYVYVALYLYIILYYHFIYMLLSIKNTKSRFLRLYFQQNEQ